MLKWGKLSLKWGSVNIHINITEFRSLKAIVKKGKLLNQGYTVVKKKEQIFECKEEKNIISNFKGNLLSKKGDLVGKCFVLLLLFDAFLIPDWLYNLLCMSPKS